MKTPQLKTTLIALGSLALTLISQAANYNLTASDAVGITAFSTKTNWSSGAAPAAGNNYFTSTFGMRTPPDNLNYTFGGDSLTRSGDQATRHRAMAAVSCHAAGYAARVHSMERSRRGIARGVRGNN